ncbi:MAG: ABC transporter permease [Bacteroidota bacterium]
MNIFQFFSEGLQFAWGAITSNRTRALLTMLGVATGIFAISSILTLVSSMKSSITENLSSLGNTTLFVHNWPWTDNGEDWYQYVNRPKMSFRDFQKLKQGLDEVEAVGYSVTVGGQEAKYGALGVSRVEAVGITDQMERFGGFNLSAGRAFSPVEYQMGPYNCIIGYEIKEGLFPEEEAVGKYIRFGGKKWLVIGVKEKVGVPLGGPDDDDISVPYKSLKRAFNLESRRVDKLVMIKLSNYEQMEYVESEITGIMRASRGLKPGTKDNFSINKQESIMNAINGFFGVLEIGGVIVSLFSVLIGGFSIGNIMYISVRERTNEIGIQKSLGATKSFILYQFMTESVIICLLGGVMGLIGVYGVTTFVQWLITSNELPFNVFITMKDIGVAMGLAAVIGLVSGFLPSWIASVVDPVIAIRHS